MGAARPQQVELAKKAAIDAFSNSARDTKHVRRSVSRLRLLLYVLVLVATVPTALLLALWRTQGFSHASDGDEGQQLLTRDGSEVAVAPVNYWSNTSGCMTDDELRDATIFIVDLEETVGITYGLRADSIVRLPVSNSTCGRALLVRAADPDNDVLMVEREAVLINKQQTSNMLTYIMTDAGYSSPTEGEGAERRQALETDRFRRLDDLVAEIMATASARGTATHALGKHWLEAVGTRARLRS